MKVARIDKLTKAQIGRFDQWADKWIEIGLRTAAADRPRFEAAAEKCYRYADIPWHGNIVWVPQPPLATSIPELTSWMSCGRDVRAT